MRLMIISALVLALCAPFVAKAEDNKISPEMSAYVDQAVRRSLTFNNANSASFLDGKMDFTQVGWYLYTEYLKSIRVIDAKDVPVADYSFTPTGAYEIYPMHRMDMGLRVPGNVFIRGLGAQQSYLIFAYIGLKLDKSSSSENPRYLIHKLVLTSEPAM